MKQLVYLIAVFLTTVVLIGCKDKDEVENPDDGRHVFTLQDFTDNGNVVWGLFADRLESGNLKIDSIMPLGGNEKVWFTDVTDRTGIMHLRVENKDSVDLSPFTEGHVTGYIPLPDISNPANECEIPFELASEDENSRIYRSVGTSGEVLSPRVTIMLTYDPDDSHPGAWIVISRYGIYNTTLLDAFYFMEDPAICWRYDYYQGLWRLEEPVLDLSSSKVLKSPFIVNWNPEEWDRKTGLPVSAKEFLELLLNAPVLDGIRYNTRTTVRKWSLADLMSNQVFSGFGFTGDDPNTEPTGGADPLKSEFGKLHAFRYEDNGFKGRCEVMKDMMYPIPVSDSTMRLVISPDRFLNSGAAETLSSRIFCAMWLKTLSLPGIPCGIPVGFARHGYIPYQDEGTTLTWMIDDREKSVRLFTDVFLPVIIDSANSQLFNDFLNSSEILRKHEEQVMRALDLLPAMLRNSSRFEIGFRFDRIMDISEIER